MNQFIKWMPLLLLSFTLAQTPDKYSVSLAYQDRIVDAVVVAAIERGFFLKQGIQVKGSLFKSGPECTEALLHGGADVATMGDAAAVILMASQGQSFEILASHGNGEHRHRVVAKLGIKSPKELEGKLVAVKFGTSTHAGLIKYLEKNHYSWKLMDMSPSLQMTALVAGEIFAFVASEPEPSQAEYKGMGHVIADMGGLGNEYPVLLVANKKWLVNNKESGARMVKALQEASVWLSKNKDEMALVLADRSGMSPETAKKSMSLHQYEVKTASGVKASLAGIKNFLVKQGVIDSP